MKPLPLLPPETLSAIVELLAPGDVVRVSHANRKFWDISRRVLYRSIVLTDHEPERTTRCLDALAANPRLAATVRRFVGRWQSVFIPSEFRLSISVRVRRALLNMPGLTDLDLALPHGIADDWIVEKDHAAAATAATAAAAPAFPFTLRRFACGFEREEKLVAFLTSQPDIASLDLRSWMPIALPASCLPRLKELHANAATASELVQNRPVTSFKCAFGPLLGQDVDMFVQFLTKASCPLVSLDVVVMSQTPEVVRAIARAAPGLVFLRLAGVSRPNCDYRNHFSSFVEQITPDIGLLTKLEVIDLSTSMTYDGKWESCSECEPQAARSWGRACPSLRSIIFPSLRHWTLGRDGWKESGQSKYQDAQFVSQFTYDIPSLRI